MAHTSNSTFYLVLQIFILRVLLNIWIVKFVSRIYHLLVIIKTLVIIFIWIYLILSLKHIHFLEILRKHVLLWIFLYFLIWLKNISLLIILLLVVKVFLKNMAILIIILNKLLIIIPILFNILIILFNEHLTPFIIIILPRIKSDLIA